MVSIETSSLTVTPAAPLSTMWRRPSAVATRNMSAPAASITSTFSPSRTMPSPSGFASRVKPPTAAGEPASQRAGVPRFSPTAIGRNQRSRCSSEPQSESARPAIVFENSGEGASA